MENLLILINLLFSKRTYDIRNRERGKILGVRLVRNNERYLGNPLIMNGNINSRFLSLIAKIRVLETPLLSTSKKRHPNKIKLASMAWQPLFNTIMTLPTIMSLLHF